MEIALHYLSGFPAYLCVLSFSYLFFNWLFLRARPQGPVFWKQVDVFWLAAGTLSVVLAFIQNRIAFDEELARQVSFQSVQRREAIKDALEGAIYSATCNQRIYTLETDYDKERNQQCRWFEAALNRYKSIAPNEPVTGIIDEEKYPQPAGGSLRLKSRLEFSVSEYNSAQTGTNFFQRRARSTWWENFLRSSAPYLLALALGFRLVKARADVLAEAEKIAKEKAANPDKPEKLIKAPPFNIRRLWL